MFNQFYADGFQNERFGLVSGSAVGASFPNVPAKIARFIAYGSNGSKFYVGRNGSQTYELAAGIQTDWFSVAGENLNAMQFKSASGTMDKLAYWVQW